MTITRPRKLFVNLPVQDLRRSTQFFTSLGFVFHPRLTDERGACMIVGAECSVMLLSHEFFQTFTRKALCDAQQRTEGIFALTCDSEEEVDSMVEAALAAGGTRAMDPVRHGSFMYGWSFYDLDHHHWEVLHLNPAALAS